MRYGAAEMKHRAAKMRYEVTCVWKRQYNDKEEKRRTIKAGFCIGV